MDITATTDELIATYRQAKNRFIIKRVKHIIRKEIKESRNQQNMITKRLKQILKIKIKVTTKHKITFLLGYLLHGGFQISQRPTTQSPTAESKNFNITQEYSSNRLDNYIKKNMKIGCGNKFSTR